MADSYSDDDIFLTILQNKKQDEEDEEETLSFCDLPAYSKAAEWAKYSTESKSCSSSSSSSNSISTSSEEDQKVKYNNNDSDYFEFFSSEWNKNAVSNPPDNIIFCGKLIPAQKQQQHSPGNAQNTEKKIRRGGACGLLQVFRRMRSSSTKVTIAKLTATAAFHLSDPISPLCQKQSSPTKDDDGVRSLTITRSSSSSSSGRSKWHFFFGFSADMELRDIKNRKSQRIISSSASRRAENGGGGEENELVSGGDGAARRRLWWLIRALSCGGSHHSLVGSVGGVDGIGFP